MSNNFKGLTKAKVNVSCQRCGRIVGPTLPIKNITVQYGAGAGSFCSNTCAYKAYKEVTDKYPELKTKREEIFK